MLSRIAESMFWIGRYVERAEDTARILDVQTQLILEDADHRRGDDLPRPAVDHGRRGRPRPAGRPRPGAGRALPTTPPRRPRSPRRSAAAREAARRARETLSVPMWEAINTTYRAIPSGPVPRAAAAGDLPVGARAGGADQRHRRRHDDPRRGLALPHARPLRRARRHDLAAGRDARRWPRGVGAPWTHDAARLRRLRGVPAHLPRPGDRAGGGGVPAARPAVPALGGASPSTAPSSAWTTSSRRQRAGFQNEAQRLLGRTRAELEYRSLVRRDGRPARTRWSGCSAPARWPPRRSPGATSPAPRRWPGRGCER